MISVVQLSFQKEYRHSDLSIDSRVVVEEQRNEAASAKVWALRSLGLTIVGWADTSRGDYEVVLLGHTACCFNAGYISSFLS